MKKQKILEWLREAAKYARLETAEFGDIHHNAVRPVRFTDGRLVTEANVTEFIRDRVRLHHQTWVIGFIKEAIRLIEEGR